MDFLKKMSAVLVNMACLLIACQAFCATHPNTSIVGDWQTIDQNTKHPSTLIRIYESKGKYFGKIVKIYPGEGRDPHKVCTHCKGAMKNKPVVGMLMISGLVKQGDKYVGGKITDPRSGEQYNCELRLGDDGQELYVRGYLGISLLGKTSVWRRAPVSLDQKQSTQLDRRSSDQTAHSSDAPVLSGQSSNQSVPLNQNPASSNVSDESVSSSGQSSGEQMPSTQPSTKSMQSNTTPSTQEQAPSDQPVQPAPSNPQMQPNTTTPSPQEQTPSSPSVSSPSTTPSDQSSDQQMQSTPSTQPSQEPTQPSLQMPSDSLQPTSPGQSTQPGAGTTDQSQDSSSQPAGSGQQPQEQVLPMQPDQSQPQASSSSNS